MDLTTHYNNVFGQHDKGDKAMDTPSYRPVETMKCNLIKQLLNNLCDSRISADRLRFELLVAARTGKVLSNDDCEELCREYKLNLNALRKRVSEE